MHAFFETIIIIKEGRQFFFGEYLTIILIHLVVVNNDDIEIGTERRGNCINICAPEYIINKHL